MLSLACSRGLGDVATYSSAVGFRLGILGGLWTQIKSPLPSHPLLATYHETTGTWLFISSHHLFLLLLCKKLCVTH